VGGKEWCVEGFWQENLRAKGPLGNPRRTLANNIKIYLQNVRWWGNGLD